MAWSPETNTHFLATGANDNLVHVWDDRNVSAPIHTFSDHQAAIKAMAFCPWQPRTLATGGGSQDRNIRIWNTSTGNLLNCIDTGSQVSSIIWSSEEYKELASSHGYSHNQVTGTYSIIFFRFKCLSSFAPYLCLKINLFSTNKKRVITNDS